MTYEEVACFCDKCPLRFKCFTQKRVYTDPSYQALYETYIAEGESHDKALQHIKALIEDVLVKEALQNAKPTVQPVDKKWIDEYRKFKKSFWGDNNDKYYYERDYIENVKQ